MQVEMPVWSLLVVFIYLVELHTFYLCLQIHFSFIVCTIQYIQPLYQAYFFFFLFGLRFKFCYYKIRILHTVYWNSILTDWTLLLIHNTLTTFKLSLQSFFFFSLILIPHLLYLKYIVFLHFPQHFLYLTGKRGCVN